MTRTDEKWVERIEQWKASGKTAEEFTTGQPYKASTLKWRAAQLRRSAEGGERNSRGKAAAGAIRMARVVRRARGDGQRAGLVIEVAGAHIAVLPGFDAELLAEVVHALGASR